MQFAGTYLLLFNRFVKFLVAMASKAAVYWSTSKMLATAGVELGWGESSVQIFQMGSRNQNTEGIANCLNTTMLGLRSCLGIRPRHLMWDMGILTCV